MLELISGTVGNCELYMPGRVTSIKLASDER